jgi:hypothetical protein
MTDKTDNVGRLTLETLKTARDTMNKLKCVECGRKAYLNGYCYLHNPTNYD